MRRRSSASAPSASSGGKPHKPYEFGVKVSITTTNRRCPFDRLRRRPVHPPRQALPGNPYDGHTLAPVIEETEALTGCPIERAYVDKGYRARQGPCASSSKDQKRGVHGAIKRELRRRSAIEPVIGHLKSDRHLGRNGLKGVHGDGNNAVLSAIGHNLRLVLRWLRLLLGLTLAIVRELFRPRSGLIQAS